MVSVITQTDCLTNIKQMLNEFEPITLEQMSGVRLMNRTDTKFVISVEQLTELLAYARDHYFAQETEGERLIEYRTTYYDTKDWAMLRAHTSGRLTRQKIRVRTYVSSDLTFVEIKNKNNKGRTKKKRTETQRMPGGTLSPDACAYIDEFGKYDSTTLSPAVENDFRRVTLVSKNMTERLTIDTQLELTNCRNGEQTILAGTAVVEVKRNGLTHSPIIDWLKGHKIRKNGFSKYCYGALLTDGTLPLGIMKPKLRKLRKRQLI